jgi:hypothetical protein
MLHHGKRKYELSTRISASKATAKPIIMMRQRLEVATPEQTPILLYRKLRMEHT